MATRKTKARKTATRRTARATTKRTRTATKRATKKTGAAKKKKRGQEQPNLEALTSELRERFRSRMPTNYLRGKDRIRDELMDLLACSSVRAEHIVDSMVARGYARFGRHPRFANDPRFGIWHLDPSP